jgi:hypothetical protein
LWRVPEKKTDTNLHQSCFPLVPLTKFTHSTKMGNKQTGEGYPEPLEESSMSPRSQASHEPRKSRHLSMESVSAEISLDGNFISTGQTSVDSSGRPALNGRAHRRLTSTQFLGLQGDKAVAASPQKRPTHQRKSTIPQQVLKFEKQSKSHVANNVLTCLPFCHIKH